MEALDAAAVEAALSLCEEAVSEEHTLPGPWETQDLKATQPKSGVQDVTSSMEQQDASAMSASILVSVETQCQTGSKREEQLKGNCEAAEVTGSDVMCSDVTSEDGAAGGEMKEEAAMEKETTEALVKSEGEEWSQPEPNPPCLGESLSLCFSLPPSLSLTPVVSVPQTLRTALCLAKSQR